MHLVVVLVSRGGLMEKDCTIYGIASNWSILFFVRVNQRLSLHQNNSYSKGEFAANRNCGVGCWVGGKISYLYRSHVSTMPFPRILQAFATRPGPRFGDHVALSRTHPTSSSRLSVFARTIRMLIVSPPRPRT